MEKKLKKHLPNGVFDGISSERSRHMSSIPSKGNKSTEKRLRFALVQAGISGWQMHADGLSGRPDFYFPESRLAVFVDGCFWHGCPKCGHYPKTRSAFWKAKIDRNRQRDFDTTTRLESEGVRVLRFWEHELHSSLRECVARLVNEL